MVRLGMPGLRIQASDRRKCVECGVTRSSRDTNIIGFLRLTCNLDPGLRLPCIRCILIRLLSVLYLCSRNLAICVWRTLSGYKKQRPRPCVGHTTTFADDSFESPILRTYVDRVGRSVRSHRVASVLSSPRSSKLIHIFAGWHTRHGTYGARCVRGQ